jgi:hypothetical protein
MRSATARAAALGVACFLLVCLLPGPGLYTGQQVGDVKLFQTFGDRLLEGEIPYRDVFVEYPPAALPAFVLPSLAPADEYTLAFKGLQILFGCAAVALVAVTLGLLGGSRRRLYAGTLCAALAPLALGPTVLNRYDLWPAALLAGALAALVARRSVLGLALLAVAVLAKGYAAVVLPVALLYVHRHGGRDETRRAAIAFAAAAAAVTLPFAALGPGGLKHSFWIQASRGLHVESLGASLLEAADRLGLYTTHVVGGFAFELEGSLPTLVGSVSTLVQLAALAGVWLLFARGPATPERLVAGSAAAVAAFVAFGKVLSPQFLIWLVPLVPLVAPPAGVTASAALLVALGLTQAFFPERYRGILDVHGEVWILLARNAALAALALVLLASLRQRTKTTKPPTVERR